MSDSSQRRNPLRLIVSKETQLHILRLVGCGVFAGMASALLIEFCLTEWLWTVALCLVIGAFVSLGISRSIAGPFYRIEKDLEKILSGRHKPELIQVRPNDPLEHLAELVNQLVEQTRK